MPVFFDENKVQFFVEIFKRYCSLSGSIHSFRIEKIIPFSKEESGDFKSKLEEGDTINVGLKNDEITIKISKPKKKKEKE